MSKILGYILALTYIVIFALFCSGRVGWFLLLAAILCPIFSIFFMLLVRNRINIIVDVEEMVVAKRNTCNLLVTIENKSFLPTPAIRLIFAENAHFKDGEQELLVNVGIKGREKFTNQYKGIYAGGSSLGVKQAVISDYLGIVNLRIKDKQIVNSIWSMGIVPEISVSKTLEGIENDALQATASDNDSDDTIEDNSNIFGGFPGYEYREYQPGDPLKRINSKLSGKMDRLMVRLDERNVISTMAVVIDPIFIKKGAEALTMEKIAICEENTIESSLGVALFFIRHEYAVNYYVRGEYGWEYTTLTNENELEEMRKSLADYVFKDDSVTDGADNTKRNEYSIDERIPEMDLPAVVYCTPRLDNSLAEALTAAKNSGVQRLNVYIADTCEGRAM